MVGAGRLRGAILIGGVVVVAAAGCSSGGSSSSASSSTSRSTRAVTATSGASGAGATPVSGDCDLVTAAQLGQPLGITLQDGAEPPAEWYRGCIYNFNQGNGYVSVIFHGATAAIAGPPQYQASLQVLAPTTPVKLPAGTQAVIHTGTSTSGQPWTALAALTKKGNYFELQVVGTAPKSTTNAMTTVARAAAERADAGS
jgi:hypothetical protein